MSAVERASSHAGIDIRPDEHQPIEHERPEDWGWNANLGKEARIGGVISIIVLLIGLSATHYNGAGDVAILLTVAALVIGLIWDARHRKRSFRG